MFPGPFGDHVHGPTYSPDGEVDRLLHHYGALLIIDGISVIRPN